MKKLLTILALAALLCLVCSVALAAQETYTFADFPLATINVDGVDRAVTDSNLAAANAAQHNAADKWIHVRVYYYDDDGNPAYKEVAVDVHTYTTFVEHKVKPTCWSTGIDVYKCNVCGRIDPNDPQSYREVAKTDHSAQWYNKIKEEATCSEEGVSGTYCPVCKCFDPKSFSTTPKTVHIYTGMVETQDYTCQHVGYYDMVCINCGKVDPDNNHIKVDNLADYEALLFDPNYTQLGSHIPGVYDGHDWNAWSLETPANCYHANIWMRWCKNGCKTTQTSEAGYNEVGDWTGWHAWETEAWPVWTIDYENSDQINCQAATVKFTCAICKGQANKGGEPAHPNGPALPADADSITPEGEVYDPDGNFFMVLPHVYDVTDPAFWADGANADGTQKKVPATCTTAGCYRYLCTLCADPDHLKIVEIPGEPALGHLWGEWKKSTALDENGNPYYYRYCERGDAEDRVFDLKPADLCTEHNWKVTETPATCTAEGKKVSVCQACGTEKEETIPALGHDWDETVKKAATCKEEGLVNRICKRCNTAEANVKVDKLPHTWDEGVITKEATKEAKGEKTFTCTVCGETKTEEVDWTPSEPAKYTMTASYDGNTVTGKLVHDDTTVEADVKNIRVTFYIEGNYYMATMAEVAADGTFSVDGVGPIVYITVAATGNTSVNPEDYQKIAEPVEIFVK